MHDSPIARSTAVKILARDLGFDLVGIVRPTPSAHGDAYRAWIAAGKQGEMHYLGRNIEERLDVQTKFPWAKSILCVGLSYWQEPPSGSPPNENVATEPAGGEGGEGKVARYAWGRDYHKVIENKLKKLERQIRDTYETADAKIDCRAYADTGPILERELAVRAGLGWIGKNTLLIHPRHGSWFLLGELILSLELAPDDPIGDHCGTCRRCIEACPTAAITPHSVDASKCISYLTLEHRGTIAEEFHAPMQQAGFIVGCDICQEVCPFNRRPLPTSEPDFAPRSPAPAVSLQQVLAWEEQEWDILTRGRASRRAKFPMWQRNASILQPQRAVDAPGSTPESSKVPS